MRKNVGIWMVAMMLLVSSHVEAQESRSLHFEQTTVDMGVLSEDEAPSVYRFAFRNVGAESVTLRVVTSCGCTEAVYPTSPVKPGEAREISLTYDPNEHPGRVYTRTFVYTDRSGDTPEAELALTGTVTLSKKQWRDFRYGAGVLRMRRKAMTFLRAGVKGTGIETLYCVNTGDKPLRLTALREMLPAYAEFWVDPEVIPPATTANIYLKVYKDRLPEGAAERGCSFPLILEGLNCPPSERTIRVSIEPGF